MRSLFKSKHKITQQFGVNEAYYKQFGLSGHEGLDLIPTGSVWDVLCLEDGVVVRDIDDVSLGKNYGKNVTIWHPTVKKATQYCHLASNSVKMGQRLVKGETLGVMGATGNTTGAHVHLNLFDVDDNGIRLGRDNGFFGGINPLPFLEEDVSTPDDTIPVKRSDFENLVRKSTITDKIREKLNTEDNEVVILAEIEKLIKYEDAVVQKDSQLNKATEEIGKLQATIAQMTTEQGVLKKENEEQKEAVEQQAQTILEQTGAITDISDKLEKLKTQCNAPVILTGIKRAIYELLLKL